MATENMSKRSGFSLIETLVVISITIILSGILLGYNNSNQNQIALYRDQAFIEGLFNQAKSLTAEKYNQSDLGSSYFVCGYGVHFDLPRNYYLFRDVNRDCTKTNYHYDQGGNPGELITAYSLDPRVQFIGLPSQGLDIVYVAPDLTTVSSLGFPSYLNFQTINGKFRAGLSISEGGQIAGN